MHKKNILPPHIAKKTKKLEIHNDVRIDNYYWLNQRENLEVIDYLKAENNYYHQMTNHTKQLQDDLYQEMKNRIKEDDESVPYKKNGYYYKTRFEKGSQYPIFNRRKGSLTSKEEILFDVNKMAKDYEYFHFKGLSISTNNKLAVFGTDITGRRLYTLQFKNLETGKLFPEKIEHTTGGATWANDNQTVFYVKQDLETLRNYKIFKHVLGTDPSTDVEVYHEKDTAFGTFVYKTKSEKYLIIGSYSTLSTEYQYLQADNPNGDFSIFQERTENLEYSIAHYNNEFYILTNKDKAINFKLMKTNENSTTMDNWLDEIPHRDDVLLEDFSIFKNHLILEERTNGLNKIRIISWDKTQDYYLPFEEETYAVGIYPNPEFESETVRYSYNSLTTPNSVFDFNMYSKAKTLLKEQEVLGGKFNKENYKSERIWAPARDGKKVPISIVYNKNTKLSSETPMLLYAYGSYGHTINDSFSTTRLSLLDRGFVFAIAHIRGSEYLGRKWYEEGKLLKKMNTFYDFIDCAKHLIIKNYTSPKHLYAMGGSAGGLLIGAVINLNPELFNGAIAAVPFVDVVTTMLDETIPLTTGEYDEWGNPNDKKYYDYMKMYSPYDNVENKLYPNLLVTTGLNDSQVQYFEPAKWVAKLRDQSRNTNIILLHTDLNVGHGGASGRFDSLKDVAREYAYLLDLEELF